MSTKAAELLLVISTFIVTHLKHKKVTPDTHTHSCFCFVVVSLTMSI